MMKQQEENEEDPEKRCTDHLMMMMFSATAATKDSADPEVMMSSSSHSSSSSSSTLASFKSHCHQLLRKVFVTPSSASRCAGPLPSRPHSTTGCPARLCITSSQSTAAGQPWPIRMAHGDLDEDEVVPVHTQVDYTNFLIPRQRDILCCAFYWGKIDRYEAEALLANKPEGSFLLRDSVQDDYVFSVSFRRYSRTLHARIEETNHQFGFGCHGPGVHCSSTVQGLLDHYRDANSCMFFEPLLLYPVNRSHCFSLAALARAAICSQIRCYGDISGLPIPSTMKRFLKEYHYKHKIRTRHLELAP